MAQSYANRARLLQKLIRSENPLIRLLLAEPSCEKVLTLWREDLADLEQSVEGFLTYFREHYLCMAENYLVYTLFQTWIRLKPEDFGKDFMIKMAEFLTFQLLAMAVWREQGK